MWLNAIQINVIPHELYIFTKRVTVFLKIRTSKLQEIKKKKQMKNTVYNSIQLGGWRLHVVMSTMTTMITAAVLCKHKSYNVIIIQLLRL